MESKHTTALRYKRGRGRNPPPHSNKISATSNSTISLRERRHCKNMNNISTGGDVRSKEGFMHLSDSIDASALSGIDSALDARVRHLKWGIFEVAYEPRKFPKFRSFFGDILPSYRRLRPFIRLVVDLWNLARWPCVKYYLYTVWLILAPAISIYIAYRVIFQFDEILHQVPVVKEDVRDVRFLALVWVTCGMISLLAENMLIESRVQILGPLRAHFIPQLVQASLDLNASDFEESSGDFPSGLDYGEFAPGWDFFNKIFTRMRYFCTSALEIFMVSYIISRQESFSAKVLTVYVILFLTISFLKPSNGVGGSGYTFWTKNTDYNKLMALFQIVFDRDHRETLFKDGLGEYLCDEYKRVSSSLGIVESDLFLLGWGLPAPWHWGVAELLFVTSPMPVCALVLLWNTASLSSLIASTAMIHYLAVVLRKSLERLHFEDESFHNVLERVAKFYTILDKPRVSKELMQLSAKSMSHKHRKGVKIALKNVSRVYPSPEPQGTVIKAIDKVNLTIEPGQTIVIAGENGSGKTTLVSLLTGIIPPTEGMVSLDNKPLSSYDTNSLRQLAVFVGNTDLQPGAIYPVSLKENILMGLTDHIQRINVTDEDVDDAAHLGCSYDLIQRLGYGTILNPTSVIAYSIGNTPSQAAVDELKRHSPDPVQILISNGEHQRLIASRAIMRAKHSSARIVVLDEPGNALDTVTERKVFDNFRQIAHRNGQTLIIVTHRLSSVARHADRIICMKSGRIVEHGTHAELMAMNGTYSSLYNAQIVQG